MKLLILTLSYILLRFFGSINGAPVCSPDTIKPNAMGKISYFYLNFLELFYYNWKLKIIDPSLLPILPDVFETRIQATIDNKETVEMLLVYDTFNSRAEFKINKKDENLTSVFYYDQNLVYSITDGNDIKTNLFFECFRIGIHQ